MNQTDKDLLDLGKASSHRMTLKDKILLVIMRKTSVISTEKDNEAVRDIMELFKEYK